MHTIRSLLAPSAACLAAALSFSYRRNFFNSEALRDNKADCPCVYCPSDKCIVNCSYARLGDQKADKADPHLQLKSVCLIFRHGARTPYRNLPPQFRQRNWSPLLTMQLKENEIPIVVDNFDTMEQSDSCYLPGGAGLGLLTVYGQSAMRELGEQWHRDYFKALHLSPNFKEDEIFLRTRNNKRCLLSLSSVLAGFFKEEKNFLNSPFHIIIKEGLLDELLPITYKESFPRALNDWNAKYSSVNNPRVLSLMKEFIELKVDKVLSSPPDVKITDLRDHLMCDQGSGGKWSDGWATNLAPCMDELNQLTTREVMLEYWGPQKFWDDSVKCSVGLLFNDLLNHTKNIRKANGWASPLTPDTLSKYKKLLIWSAQDVSLLPILYALGFRTDDLRMPEFGDNLALELYVHSLDKRVFYRLLLNNKPVFLPHTDQEFLPISHLEDQLRQFALKPEEYKTQFNQLSNGMNEFFSQYFKSVVNSLF